MALSKLPASLLLLASTLTAGCATEDVGEELAVTCDGKCDGIGSLRSLIRDAKELDLGDLVAVGSKFAADGLNRRWYGDGTEIATGEGKLHLASVLDMGSRRIVGFALSAHHDAALAYAALAMAVAVRGGREVIAGVVLHTDQGSEYTARSFRTACARCGITQSMGRPGSALDNAVIESWHSTLEFELRRIEQFTTAAQARARVAAWIEEYNRDRRHSALGMRSPLDYERALREHPPEAA